MFLNLIYIIAFFKQMKTLKVRVQNYVNDDYQIMTDLNVEKIST